MPGGVVAGDLQVDTYVLVDTGRQLASVASELRSASSRGDEAAAATGHAALAAAVSHVASGWDRARSGMVEDVDALGRACRQVAETFAELDRELGRQVRAAA